LGLGLAGKEIVPASLMYKHLRKIAKSDY